MAERLTSDCAFAPNFTVLLVLRFLYGIGMGSEWRLGAALAMEKIPTKRRLASSHGYAFSLIVTVVPVFVVVALLTFVGKEAKGISFGGRLGTSHRDATERVGGAVSE